MIISRKGIQLDTWLELWHHHQVKVKCYLFPLPVHFSHTNDPTITDMQAYTGNITQLRKTLTGGSGDKYRVIIYFTWVNRSH